MPSFSAFTTPHRMTGVGADCASSGCVWNSCRSRVRQVSYSRSENVSSRKRLPVTRNTFLPAISYIRSAARRRNSSPPRMPAILFMWSSW